MKDIQADAESFVRQLNGEGHVVYFNDGVHASTGLNPLPGYQGFKINQQGFGAFGAFGGVMETLGGAGELLRYDAQLRDGHWTFMQWDSDGGWNLKARTGDGRSYQNTTGGFTENKETLSPDDEFTIDVVDGVLALSVNTSGAQYTDDIVILPYNASRAQIEGHASIQHPMGPLPVMRMTGDIVSEQWIYVVGTVTNREYVNKPTNMRGFGWVSNAEVIRFTLTEVTPGWVYDNNIPGWDLQGLPQGAT